MSFFSFFFFFFHLNNFMKICYLDTKQWRHCVDKVCDKRKRWLHNPKKHKKKKASTINIYLKNQFHNILCDSFLFIKYNSQMSFIHFFSFLKFNHLYHYIFNLIKKSIQILKSKCKIILNLKNNPYYINQ